MEKRVADLISLNILEASAQTENDLDSLRSIIKQYDSELDPTQKELILAEISILSARHDILLARSRNNASIYGEYIKTHGYA